MNHLLRVGFIKGPLHACHSEILFRALFVALATTATSARAIEPFVVTQPAAQTNFVGGAVSFSVTSVGTAPLLYQWLFNDRPLIGETNSTLIVTNLQFTNGGLYSVGVSNAFGSVMSDAATLRVFSTGPGSLDLSFPTVLTSFRTWGVKGPRVHDMVKQPDGKVLIAGDFDHVNGYLRGSVARLLRNGDVDLSFENLAVGPRDDSGFGGLTLALQANGKILVGGVLLSCLGGCDTLVRLNANGDRDWSFAVPPHDGVTRRIVVQPDQRILVAGTFNWPDRTNSLVRLNTDGSLDDSFTTHEEYVRDMTLQPDGKIVIAGSTLASWGEYYLARLNPDGSLDENFDTSVNGMSPVVDALALQPDGKILLAGDFTNVCSRGDCVARTNLVRLNPDGSVDVSFNANRLGEYYRPGFFLKLQPDGKILVAGNIFGRYVGYGNTWHLLRRMNRDGTFDPTFVEGALWEDIGELGQVTSIVFQDNGKIWVGGFFAAYNTGGEFCSGEGSGGPDITFNNVPRDGLVRLNNDLTVCRLTAGRRTPAGDFQMIVTTLPGARVLIESSSDFVTWTPLAGLINT